MKLKRDADTKCSFGKASNVYRDETPSQTTTPKVSNKESTMPGTYTQIYIHVVFSVYKRQNLIHAEWEERLYRYISGIAANKDQKMLAIHGMPDHIHFLIGMKPSCCLSDLVREIKKASNEFIKEKKFTKSKFNWQKGFGAFSYGQSQLDNVIAYIMNQRKHHRKRTFKEEYIELLKKFKVEYDEKYLLD
jgi:REP element-mobilizing transposase RayT